MRQGKRGGGKTDREEKGQSGPVLTRDAINSSDAIHHSFKCVTIIERYLDSGIGTTWLRVDCSNGSPGLCACVHVCVVHI